MPSSKSTQSPAPNEFSADAFHQLHQLQSGSATAAEPGVAWFRATTPTGELFISVKTARFSQLRMNDATHALFLGLAQEQLTILEDWLGCPLDLSPCENNCAHPEVFTLSRRDDYQSDLTLYLPLSSLQALPIFFETDLEDSAVQITWALQSLCLTLQHFEFSKRDFAKLNNQAIILLPLSFSMGWNTHLRSAGSTTQLKGSIIKAPLMWIVNEYANDGHHQIKPRRANPLAGTINGTLTTVVHIPMQALIGFSAGQAYDILNDSALNEARLSLDNGECIHGSIKPLGKGFAFHANA